MIASIKKLQDRYLSLPVQVKASFWFLISAFLQKGISVITTPIFTRLLSTAEYGQYNVFNSWLGIITVFITLQLYSGVFTQGMVKFENRKYQFASSMQGLCLTLVFFWTIIYLLFQDMWNHLFGLTTVQILVMIIMIWSSSVFSFWSVEQRVDFHYHKLVAISIITSIAKPVIGIVFVVLANDKVTARILGLALVELVAYTWMFFSQMRKGRVFFDKFFWKHALKFNLPLIPHYLSMTVLNSSDRIMINSMIGSDEAGIYSLAYSVSQIMTLFNAALLQTIEPWLYKKIKAKKVEDISDVAYPAFILIAAVNILLIAFAPEVIRIFAPATYYDAIWVIPPVTMSVYFMFAYTFFAVFEFYYEKTQYVAIATVSGAALNIVLNYIFIKLFGYYAAGYTTLFCYVIFAVYHYYFMRKICKEKFDGAMPYKTSVLMMITFVFLALGFIFLLLYNNNIVRYIFIAFLIFIMIIYRNKIKELIKKLISIKQSKSIPGDE